MLCYVNFLYNFSTYDWRCYVLLMWIMFWCWKIDYLNYRNCGFFGLEVDSKKKWSQDMSFSWVTNNEYKPHFVDVICYSHVAYTIYDLIKCCGFLNIFLHVLFYQFFFLIVLSSQKTPNNLSLVIFHDGILLVH
jgi:hypothetical protein